MGWIAETDLYTCKRPLVSPGLLREIIQPDIDKRERMMYHIGTMTETTPHTAPAQPEQEPVEEMRQAADQILRNFPGNALREAKALQILTTLGRRRMELVEEYGISDDTVCIRLKLLELHPEVQLAVLKGRIISSVARQLRRLPRESQIALLPDVLGKTYFESKDLVEQELERLRPSQAQLLRQIRALLTEDDDGRARQLLDCTSATPREEY